MKWSDAEIPAGGEWELEFGWGEFVEFARDNSRKYGWGDSQEPGNDWRGKESWEEVLTLAVEGWRAGRDLMSDYLGTVAAERMLPRKGWDLDVAGAFPIVPAAVGGDPACMWIDAEQASWRRPVLSLVINIGVNAGVPAESMMAYGSVVLALCDELEQSGVQCEIWAGDAGIGRESPNFHWSILSLVKSQGQPLDIDRAAFALVHPAMLRRLVFAACEGLRKRQMYGYGSATAPHLPCEGAILLGPAKAGDEQNIPALRERIMGQFFAQIEKGSR